MWSELPGREGPIGPITPHPPARHEWGQPGERPPRRTGVNRASGFLRTPSLPPAPQKNLCTCSDEDLFWSKIQQGTVKFQIFSKFNFCGRKPPHFYKKKESPMSLSRMQRQMCLVCGVCELGAWAKRKHRCADTSVIHFTATKKQNGPTGRRKGAGSNKGRRPCWYEEGRCDLLRRRLMYLVVEPTIFHLQRRSVIFNLIVFFFVLRRHALRSSLS